MKMESSVYMEENKTYTKKGYIVIGKRYAVVFNETLFKGYNWYTTDGLNFIGIKAEKNTLTISNVASLNYVWRILK